MNSLEERTGTPDSQRTAGPVGNTGPGSTRYERAVQWMCARRIRGAMAAFALMFTWSAAGAAQERIAGAKAMRCTFSRIATGTWMKDGAADATVKPASLVLRFDEIDADTGIAQLRNGSVGSEVTVRLAEGYLNFMQAFRTGPLYVTTVFEAGAVAGKFKAVHSRHEYFSTPLPDATSSPEQYYGECEIQR